MTIRSISFSAPDPWRGVFPGSAEYFPSRFSEISPLAARLAGQAGLNATASAGTIVVAVRRMREKHMIRIACLLVLSASFATASFAQDAAVVTRGEGVYAAQKCSVCHAVAGKGNAKGVLDGVGAKLSADEIHQWIVAAPQMAAKTKAARKPAMKAYSALPKEDVEALVAYLQSLKKG